MSTPDQPQQPAAPVLRIEAGNPTPEELAALVAVILAGSAAGEGGAPEPPRSRWAAPQARLRATGPGAGAWRFSGMPL